MKTLDWGHVTPGGANLAKNEFVYVFNHDITSSQKIDRTIRFILGKLLYYDNHLPKNARHIVNIDIRGQQMTDTTCEFISTNLIDKYKRSGLLTIRFAK